MPYQNPINPAQFTPYQQSQMMRSYQPLPKYEIIHVNGRNGAEMFQMAPNSSTLLLDETAPIVWLAMTDGAGYKTVTPYSIAPYQPEPEIDTKSLLQRIEKLEAAINEQSNNTDTRKSDKSTDSADKANG